MPPKPGGSSLFPLSYYLPVALSQRCPLRVVGPKLDFASIVKTCPTPLDARIYAALQGDSGPGWPRGREADFVDTPFSVCALFQRASGVAQAASALGINPTTINPILHPSAYFVNSLSPSSELFGFLALLALAHSPSTVYLASRAPMPGGVGAASAVLSKPYCS